MSKFADVPNSIDFVANDHKILAFWKEQQIFKKSEQLHATSGKHYVFYDGPPGTNGRPHIGHIMQSALKDVWPRYKTMRGYISLRKGGWDTHGLPVELTAEKELGLAGKVDIERYGIKEFVEYCRNTVLRCRNDWVQAITRLGRFLDMENDYLTMSNDFIQSDWWGLKQAFKKGLLYQDYKIVPFCSRCGTALSNHEVAQGYKDVTDLTITAKFPLNDGSNRKILAWTTTPWTLIGNLALAVNATVEYVAVESELHPGEQLILAKETLEKNGKALGQYTIKDSFLGSKLEGLSYTALWDTAAPTLAGRISEVICDDYVTTTDGTGVVHIALYGEDDFRIIKKHGFKQNQHVQADGTFSKQCGTYAGRNFKEEGLDVEIVKDLHARGLLFDKYRYEHSYPHCWRCSTALMYFAKTTWFLRTTQYKDQMIAENNKINWQPPHIKEGRFGNWLENNVDWAISRDRYWGSPFPIWSRVDDPTKQVCVESIDELIKLGAFDEKTGKPISANFDLHMPYIDSVVFKDGDGRLYKREPGVLDCWYNAGIMPWGQFGYPATAGAKEIFESQFPADFICEAIDQTRGWFYTLLAVSCMIDGRSSFKNVICTEHVLDATGKKMSKSLGNVVDPLPLIEKFGADAVRWTFYEGDPWLSKRYSEELPKEALRATLIPIWNCFSFFVTYANLDGWSSANYHEKHDAEKVEKNRTELDRWIISLLGSTIREVSTALDTYDISRATIGINSFVDSLSNWYIRRSRKRFWKSGDDSDKRAAYSTLYRVLNNLALLIAPLAPFMAESIYQVLKPGDAESVHLASWPDDKAFTHEGAIEREVAVIQEAASLTRALREEHGLKVRQPLAQLVIVLNDYSLAANLEHHIESLKEEVNIREVKFAANIDEYVEMVVKPNWKVMGPKFGERIKEVAGQVSKLESSAVRNLAAGQSVTMSGDVISPEDVVIELKAKEGQVARSGKSSVVVLDTKLTADLVRDGHAREVLSLIQRLRKESGLEISDRIHIKLWGEKELLDAVTAHKDYLASECLANQLEIISEMPGNSTAKELTANGLKLGLEIAKAS